MELLGLALVLFLIYLLVEAHIHCYNHRHEWHYWPSAFRGQHMRRLRPDGTFEYRAETADEWLDRQ